MAFRKYDLVCTITGASGFVGSHLARALLNHDEYKIRVFGADLYKTDRIADLEQHEDFEFFDYDVHQPLRSDLLGVDVFYHFAGIADPSRYLTEPIKVMDLNLMGLKNILERATMWSSHRPRMVYSSTSEVYGLNENVPFDESSSTLMFGPTQKRRWCYAMSKAVGEHYLQAYEEQHGFKYTIFRFFNFVGKDVDSMGAGRVITRMVGDALSEGVIKVTEPGSQTRCFTYVDDFVVPLVRAATMKLSYPDRWKSSYLMNLGSDEEVSMIDLGNRIARLLRERGHDVAVELRSGHELYGKGYQDMQRRVPDTSEAARVLDWGATLKLDQFLPTIVDAVIASR